MNGLDESEEVLGIPTVGTMNGEGEDGSKVELNELPASFSTWSLFSGRFMHYSEAFEEKVVVTFSLLVLSFLFLVPARRIRRRSKTDKVSSELTSKKVSPMECSIQRARARAPLITPTTQEETFEQLWPTIRMSGYRRLVLPPECRLVDIPKRLTIISTKDDSKESKKSNKSTVSDDDNPAQRLWNYFKQFLHLMKNFISYDFSAAGWLLIDWIQTWIKLRRNKEQEKGKINAEEEDDENSQASNHNNADTTGMPRSSIHEKSLSFTIEHIQAEEKKDEDTRQMSNSSIYQDAPLADEDENDVGEFLPPPHSARLSVTRKSSIGTKKKDALDVSIIYENVHLLLVKPNPHKCMKIDLSFTL